MRLPMSDKFAIITIDDVDIPRAPNHRFTGLFFCAHQQHTEPLYALLYNRSNPKEKPKGATVTHEPHACHSWYVEFPLVRDKIYTLIVYTGEVHHPDKYEIWCFKAD